MAREKMYEDVKKKKIGYILKIIIIKN